VNKISYDSLKSFTHLGHVCGSGSMLVVHQSTPFESMNDVIAMSKADPNKWSYGTSGVAPGRKAYLPAGRTARGVPKTWVQ